MDKSEVVAQMMAYLESERKRAKDRQEEIEDLQREIAQKSTRTPASLSWRHPFQRLRQWYLTIRSKNLQEECSHWQQLGQCCLEAKAQLEQGDYRPAIDLLETLIDTIPAFNILKPAMPLGDNPASQPSPSFSCVVELRNRLLALQKQKIAKDQL